jgi:hypothetical protein
MAHGASLLCACGILLAAASLPLGASVLPPPAGAPRRSGPAGLTLARPKAAGPSGLRPRALRGGAGEAVSGMPQVMLARGRIPFALLASRSIAAHVPE